jgi:HlyD family secretion protein
MTTHASPPNGDGSPAIELPGRGDAMLSERVRALRLDKGKAFVRRRRRRWPWFVALAILLAGGFAAQRYVGGRRGPVEEVEAVVATSERPLDVALDTTGYVIAHCVVKINSRIPGRVVELRAAEGDKVSAGQLLIRLDDEQYRDDLEQAKAAQASAQAALDELRHRARPEEVRKARAAVEQAEAQLDLSTRELDRAQQIKDVLTPNEFDRLVSSKAQAAASVDQFRQALRLVELGAREERIAVATADVESARAAVAKAQFFIDNARITTPVGGVMLQRNVELGEMIRPESPTGSLCSVADLGWLEAEIDVQERDLGDVRRGQPCLVTPDAYSDREYAGRVDWFAPSFNRQRGVRQVKVKIERPDEMLAPDMNCRVQILRQAPPTDRRMAVLVPQAAVQNGNSLWIIEDESARRRTVELGAVLGDRVEVARGIDAGAVVLLPGDKRLDDGQRVIPRMKVAKKSR